MTNTMVMATNEHGTTYITCPTKNVDKFLELLFDCAVDTVETFEVNTMLLESLPSEVQEKAKDILKAYDKVHIVYEHGKFEVSTSYCIKANYGYDHFWCGEYYAKDIYTTEERAQHLAELNSYEFPEWAW